MLLMVIDCLSYCIECSFGYYGFNCNQACNGCLADACDKEYDSCRDTSGCKSGWQYGHHKCDKGILHIYCNFSLRLI